MENKIKILPRTRAALEKLERTITLKKRLEKEVQQKEDELITNGIRARYSTWREREHQRLATEFEELQKSLAKASEDLENLFAELPYIFLDEYGLNETHAQISDEAIGGKKIFHASYKFGVDVALKNLVCGNYQPGQYRKNLAGIASYWGDEAYFLKRDEASDTPVVVAMLNNDAKVHEIDWSEYVDPSFSDCKDVLDEEDFNLLLALEHLSGSGTSVRCFLDVALGYDACKIRGHNPENEVFAVYNRGALTLSSNPISTLGDVLCEGRGITQTEEEKEES